MWNNYWLPGWTGGVRSLGVTASSFHLPSDDLALCCLIVLAGFKEVAVDVGREVGALSMIDTVGS